MVGVVPGQLHRGIDVPETLEIGAFDHPAIPDIETRDDTFCNHTAAPFVRATAFAKSMAPV